MYIIGLCHHHHHHHYVNNTQNFHYQSFDHNRNRIKEKKQFTLKLDHWFKKKYFFLCRLNISIMWFDILKTLYNMFFNNHHHHDDGQSIISLQVCVSIFFRCWYGRYNDHFRCNNINDDYLDCLFVVVIVAEWHWNQWQLIIYSSIRPWHLYFCSQFFFVISFSFLFQW